MVNPSGHSDGTTTAGWHSSSMPTVFIGKGLEPSPILMPVRKGRVYSFSDIGRETFKGLPGMLADSLPDTYGQTG